MKANEELAPKMFCTPVKHAEKFWNPQFVETKYFDTPTIHIECKFYVELNAFLSPTIIVFIIDLSASIITFSAVLVHVVI